MTPIHLFISFMAANIWRILGALVGANIIKNEMAKAAIDGMAISLISGIVVQMTLKCSLAPIYIKILSLVIASTVYIKASEKLSLGVLAGFVTFVIISYADGR